MIDATKHAQISGLLADYAHYLDEGKFREWMDLFNEHSSYEVITKENVLQNLPASLILCEDRGAIQDRIDSLGIIKYNIHTTRHILSTSRIELDASESFLAQTSFTVFQTSQEGVSKLFCCGSYEDEIVYVDAMPKFRKKRAIVDTASIPTLLAIPI